jgi:hypothetical protein
MRVEIIKNYLIVISYLLIVSCSVQPEPEEMTKIYDPDSHERFVAILDDKGVTYRVNEHGQIYYPISERSKIKAAEESIWGAIDTYKKGASVNEKVAPLVSKKLSDNKIPYEISNEEGSSTFTWNAKYDKSAMQIVSDVIREAEKQ